MGNVKNFQNPLLFTNLFTIFATEKSQLKNRFYEFKYQSKKMAVASGYRRAGGGSAAGGGAELRGSGGTQRALCRHDERGGGEIVKDLQRRGDERGKRVRRGG